MKGSCLLSITVVLILVGLACPSALGQESEIGSDKWHLQFTPYLWMSELDAEAQLGGLSGSAEMDFSDLFDFVEFAVSGRFEAWKKKWGLFVDASYLDLGADYSAYRGAVVVNADADIKQAFVNFGAAYRIINMPLGESQTQRLAVEPLCGLRYAYLKQELKLNVAVPGVGGIGGELGGDEDWVEPFVGCRIWWHLNDKLAAEIRTDFGGFGIGSASDFTWNFLAGIDYQLSDRMFFKGGYRIMDIDYEGGSGRSRIGLDGQMRGPIVGLTFHF